MVENESQPDELLPSNPGNSEKKDNGITSFTHEELVDWVIYELSHRHDQWDKWTNDEIVSCLKNGCLPNHIAEKIWGCSYVIYSACKWATAEHPRRKQMSLDVTSLRDWLSSKLSDFYREAVRSNRTSFLEKVDVQAMRKDFLGYFGIPMSGE